MGYTIKELRKGVQQEMEHTKNPRFAKKLAIDHLKEHPKYYSQINSLFKGKGAQIMFYIVFIISAIVILMMAAVFAPMGVMMNTEFYKAGDMMMRKANASIDSIQDTEVKEQVQGVIGSALDSEQNNITINAAMFQYSWIFVIGLTAFIIFIYTRMAVEYGGGVI